MLATHCGGNGSHKRELKNSSGRARQTDGIMVFRREKRKKENLGSNLDSKIVRNHDLCGDVLKEKGIRWEGDGEIMHFYPKVTNEYKLKCQTKPTIENENRNRTEYQSTLPAGR